MRKAAIASAVAVILASPAAVDAQEQPMTAAELNAQIVPGEPTTTVVPGDGSGQPDTIVTTYPGNLSPPPPEAHDREYPICRGAIQDSCRNPGEGSGSDRSQEGQSQRDAGDSRSR